MHILSLNLSLGTKILEVGQVVRIARSRKPWIGSIKSTRPALFGRSSLSRATEPHKCHFVCISDRPLSGDRQSGPMRFTQPLTLPLTQVAFGLPSTSLKRERNYGLCLRLFRRHGLHERSRFYRRPAKRWSSETLPAPYMNKYSRRNIQSVL